MRKKRPPIADRFMHRIEVRRARGDSPADIARYADCARQHGVLDRIKERLRLPERRELELIERRREEYRRKLEAARPPTSGSAPSRNYVIGGLLAGKVKDALGCTSAELDRWAADGRLPALGVRRVHILGAKTVEARVWAPEAVEAAKAAVPIWREQDKIRKIAKRRGLVLVGVSQRRRGGAV